MRYLPTSDAIRREMLATLGLETVEDLFSHIPAYCRLNRPLRIPEGCSEAEILAFFQAAAADNAPGHVSLLGAGAYHHFRPSHIDLLIGRGEWFTAYTPYQPEIAQGTLQSIFEFQTMICQLTGQEVANASMYDGSTATAEAALMAQRVSGRNEFVLARSVHPHYREVWATYNRNHQYPVREVGWARTGACDLAALQAAVTPATAAVIAQSPNFFGAVEDWEALAGLAHAQGALLIAVIAEPVSLGLLAPPAAADIVALELQGFGIPVGFGGPYAGVIASRERFVRAMPGRLVGEARDRDGKRGFVLTLSTREQHIRREKATSNICTNQALCALMASIFLATYGRRGLRELAEQNLAKATYGARACAAAGAAPLFDGAHFNEFTIRPPRGTAALQTALGGARILPGYPLQRDYPELGDALVVCATETAPRGALDQLAAALGAARPEASHAR